MLLKPCNKCGVLIPYGLTYCSKCLPIVQAEKEQRQQETKRRNDREYNKRRDPKYLQFYNSVAWRTLSAKRLSDDDYMCTWCGKLADEVDHIKEIQTPEGWELRLDYNNLRSLCHDCHNKRHKRFNKSNKRSYGENKPI